MKHSWVRILFLAAVGIVGALGLTAAAVLVLDVPVPPKPLPSIEGAFRGLSFSGLPPRSTFVARDGTRLVYRAYPGNPEDVVVLIHGSSGDAASMHFLAQAIQARGATVYALCMRGHCGTGRSGDIGYIGQLGDDLADFLKTLPPRRPGDQRVLLGFSAGGGFALRIAGGPRGKLFNRFVLVSPELPPGSPTWRTGANGAHSTAGSQWVAVAVGRIVALSILSRFGIHWFEGLPVLAFAVSPNMRRYQTRFYSYRMMMNFGPSPRYLADLQRAPGPVELLIGSRDQLFLPQAYAPLLKPVRPGMSIVIVPGVDHMGMSTQPAALTAAAAAAVPVTGMGPGERRE